MARFLPRLLCLLLLSTAACAPDDDGVDADPTSSNPAPGDPLPQPPTARPEPLDPDKVPGSVDESAPPPRVPFESGAETVPAGTEVWVANLEDSEAPERVTARDDGGFRTGVLHGEGDVLRVVLLRDGRRSLPTDLRTVMPGTQYERVQPPPCLEVPVEVPLLDGETRFAITNNCDAEVTLDARLRRELEGLSVQSPPETLGSGQSVQLSINTDDASQVDHLWLLQVQTASGSFRYPVSLYEAED